MENHNYMLIADDAGEFRDTCKAALEAKGFEVEQDISSVVCSI